MLTIRFRPMQKWPKDRARGRARQAPRFSASYDETLDLLQTELARLGAREVVIEIACREEDIRVDGWPKMNMRTADPGVAVYAETKYGPMLFATDEFDGGPISRRSKEWTAEGRPIIRTTTAYMPGWQANLRAIALSLESLRQVDRYGVTKHGEQYTGWRAIGTGVPLGPVNMTVEEAAKILFDACDVHAPDVLMASRDHRDDAFRRAAKKMHPDVGGSESSFKLLVEAKRVLDSYAA